MIEISSEDAEEMVRKTNLERTLASYEVENNVANCEHVGSIWGGSTIWHYESRSAIHQLTLDSENNYDRPPDFLKQSWDKKWETMDYYWF